MKTQAFTKGILVMVMVFVANLISVNAASPKTYMFDTKQENGKIISKTVFLQDKGLLNKEMMYEFAYNTEGKVSAKKAYRWNRSNDTWEPFFLISYQYDDATGNIHSNYVMWDKKSKSFSLNQQQMVLPASSYDEIFS